jgi:GINS complex subunit 4
MSDLDVDDLIAGVTSNGSRKQELLKHLTDAWILERNSPELLPYEERLLEDAKNALSSRMNYILEIGEIDLKINFQLVIIQTEMERLKYLIRSYLRTRLAKIDRYSLHYSRDAVNATRLSALERHYAAKHQVILERHVRASFLKEFADSAQLSRIDDTGAAGLSMVDKPDLGKAIFCKVVKPSSDLVKVGDDQLELSQGSTFLVRYSAVKQYISDVSPPLLTSI